MDIKYWYNEFKSSKHVWARIKDQCPEYKTYSNRQLKRLISQSSQIESLDIQLKCGKVVTHSDLLLTGLVEYCDCCNLIDELYLKFDWVNYMIIDENNIVKYVGHTNDLKQRLNNHKKHKKYISTDKLMISIILSEQTLYNIYKPLLNKNQQLNTTARILKDNVYKSISFDSENNENTINENCNLANMEKYIEEYNEIQTWCFDSRNYLCKCKPICSIRKYYNIFNHRPKYFPIPKEFVNEKYTKEKVVIVYHPVENIFNMYSVVKARKPKLKPETLKTIENISKQICCDLLKFPYLFFKNLQQRFSESTCKKIIGYVLSYLSVLKSTEKELIFGKDFEQKCIVYYKAKFLLDKMTNMQKESGKLTRTEEKNWVSFETLEIVLNRLKEKDLQKYTILYLYLYQNTLRSDFYNIKYKDIDHLNDNFIDFENGFLIFNHPLKVDKFQAYKVDSDCLALLKTFKNTLTSNSPYLFLKKNKTPFNPKTFAQYILLFIQAELYSIGIFNKNIGVQMLRKIVASHQRHNLVDTSISNSMSSIQIAKNMNHSEYMSKFYYFKK